MSKVNIDKIQRRLEDFDFKGLLIEELGWDHCQQRPLTVYVDGNEYTLNPIAEKRGMVVFIFDPGPGGIIPVYHTRKKIEYQVTKKSAYEHIIIFVNAARSAQIWQWVRREHGKPAACREHNYYTGQTGQALIQKLQAITFDLQEEEELDIYTVTKRAKKAFDVEKITKNFYERFRKEHKAFLSFIDGIKQQTDREWYASLMLNRMMFVYFIQKKSFLDNDPDYLRNRLRMMQEKAGNGRFHEFYRFFLLRLFHEGLGQPESERQPELNQLLGKVPYLNGGLFDVHVLEKEYPDIKIPDEAFEQIFNFFDEFNWHLDDRPLREDSEINPDVLGYIFEKYINQKQMGAYYTKEDITGYISRNAIVPFLFNAAEKEYKQAFEPGSPVWRLLKENPDRYIYQAVRKGVDLELPHSIAPGLDDVSLRTDWNKPADPGYALPTETWREHVARRKRCLELRDKLKTGEITNINDLVTYNLDICQFAQDAIENCESPELLRAFWTAIAGRIPGKSNQTFRQGVTILDPTCGSGAFLFAALNILEPLYEACLEQMRGLVSQLEPGDRKLYDFREILGQIDSHPNERYFVLKSIIINNLYGVDIMAEAVEICKLRLFLKLVAQVDNVDQVEPLPDIDFNIRTGNTLVGFATHQEARKAIKSKFDFDNAMGRIEENAQLADRAFQRFRQMQTQHGMSAKEFAQAKIDLQNRLDNLRDELDRYLAGDYHIDTDNQKKFSTWRSSHQPFHWFVEFYGIIHNGGFDVIIGNPPYVEFKNLRGYSLDGFETIECGNLYAVIVERCDILTHTNSRKGFIVPVSSISTDRYISLQNILLNHQLHFSSYDDRPGRLFDGLEHIRLTIHLMGPKSETPEIFSTRYNKWQTIERPFVFDLLVYCFSNPIIIDKSIPKFAHPTELSIIRKLLKEREHISSFYSKTGRYSVYYSRKVGYFLQVLNFTPMVLDGKGNKRLPSEFKELKFSIQRQANVILACLNSSLFYWFITVFSDCRHVNKREIDYFLINVDRFIEAIDNKKLEDLVKKLMEDLKKHSDTMEMSFNHDILKVQRIFPKYSKEIINEIDVLIGGYYGFTDEELDFIINYDIKYRMGKDLDDKE